MRFVILFALLSGIFAAPFMKEEEAKRFIRLKRQSGYWDPHHPQNQWGYTIQEQGNSFGPSLLPVSYSINKHRNRKYKEASEYWTAIRTDAQYYMDMSNMMFDRSVATENNRLYMEMLRNAQAHLDSQTGQHR